MNKKLIGLALVFTLIITLVACGETSNDDDNNEMLATSEALKDNDVCYQIFPISFADSDDDGYGDIQGIIDNVDYLVNTLDVDCVWLNPINPSPSYHKYDVVDYYDVDSRFGTIQEYITLVEVLNDNDVDILMDLVINHTSYDHPWFEASRNPNHEEYEKYRDYYVWNDFENSEENYPTQNGWYDHDQRDAKYFASFWDQMPELNFDNPDVRQEIKDIASFWLDDIGVDGFRIDAARHIYDKNEVPVRTDYRGKNIDWFIEFNDYIKSVDENAIMLSEIWLNSSAVIANYLEGMDTTFNFQTAENIIEAVGSTQANDMVSELVAARGHYGEVREDFVDSIFLSNHDQNRVMGAFNEDADKARLAANILFTLPGTSWIYYGEELGMNGSNDPGKDEDVRQPFKWSASSVYNPEGGHTGISEWNEHNSALDGMNEQLNDEASLLNHYLELIQLKKGNSVLTDGTFEDTETFDSDVIAYLRSEGDTTYLVIHHLGKAESDIEHALENYSIVYSSSDVTENDGSFTMDAHSSLVIDVSGEDTYIE